MFLLTRDRIDEDALYRAVLTDRHGAVVVFHGVVRGESKEGRLLEALEYEAYDEMAVAEMEAIGAELRRRWKDVDCAIVHRVGRVPLGDASVVIAVSSPHRAAAFAACQFAIDRLKETVPIWKSDVWGEAIL